MKWDKINNIGKELLIILVSTLLLIIIYQRAEGQEKPPRPILLVVTAEELRFGAFCVISGGTVVIDPTGNRSVSIGLIPVFSGHPFGPATLRIKGNAGTLVTIQDVPPSSLSNGGFTMALTFSSPTSIISSLGSPFVLPNNEWTDIKIGGTLTVGNPAANPPGPYIGSFNITFIQQ